MSLIQVEIQGSEAPAATIALFQINGIEGNWQLMGEGEREGVITTIAAIVAIIGGSIAIAEKIYQWCRTQETKKSVDRVLLIGKNGQRLLLKDATIEQIKALLDEEEQ